MESNRQTAPSHRRPRRHKEKAKKKSPQSWKEPMKVIGWLILAITLVGLALSVSWLK